ncbi:hypothetical protein PACTADRAFT_32558 [Pachysolen tannophilus NRRL Y-2460]|uniref:CUE domain-containing protein n=1 Tax=Pachysolen tannophilus NRRL Y-2460 TaxID=669874 RepID=A0A1E4TZ79_PACTA|nr:hypothetical protein PACTADRAFT_32558 [Pachysolen tannophilus NRRL Y-2460]
MFEKKILPSASYEFSGRFVNGKWFEMLEVLYNKGTGVHSKQVFEIEVISILSLPVAQLSKVITTDLRIDNYLMLIRLYPLLCKIVLSKNYRSLNPGLEQRLPFLSKEGRKLKAAPIFDTSHIQMVSDLFPQLNTLQIKKLLVDCDNNIEVVTNKLLEMSEEKIANLEEYKEIQNPYSSSNKRTVFDGDEISQLKLDDSRVYLGKKNKIVHPTGDLDKTSAADLKKKTLTAALRLLYESDEDEPDDTYLDQEKTFGEAQSAGKKLEIDLENEELEEELEDRSSTVKKIPTNQMDMIEHRLFAVFKKSPELFEKSARKSKNRQLMKQETGWTDEQIEGWYRMLFKSPKRFKLLDEYYNFGGGPNGIGNPNRGTLKPSSYRKSRREEEEEKEEEESNTEDDDKSTTESNKNNRFNNNGNKHEAKIISNVKKGDTDNSKEDGKSNVSEKSSKIKRARDNKNKAKKANHNRKAGHDRKMAQGFS